MDHIGKIIIFIGLIIVGIGIIILLLERFNIPLGRLPGDIFIKKENITFYFPIVTCVILSIILTIILNIFFRK